MSLGSKLVELNAQRFEEALRRAAGDVDALSVEEIEAGLIAVTHNWDSQYFRAAETEALFGCVVTMTESGGDEDYSGPREFVYHIGTRHFRKMGRYTSHVGMEIDEYAPLQQVYQRTYATVVHEWAEF